MSSVHSDSEHVSNDENDIEIKIEVPDSVEEDYIINLEELKPEDTIPKQPCVSWTNEAETCLINQYKKYKLMVDQSKFKSYREMFDAIAVEMQKNGFDFSSQKCENKWRVLERKYKILSIREELKNPGRMRDYGRWIHKKVFDEIYNQEKKNVYLEKDQTSTKPSNATSPKIDNNSLFAQTDNGQVSLSDLISSKTESIILKLEKISENSERNKEKRHLEKMALVQRQLEVQESLLRIKKQKLKLKKAKFAAIAQNLKFLKEI